MVKARSYMDVASESLGYFYWSMRPVLNACNFVGAARGDARGELLLIPFLPWCGMEFHDFSC